MIQAKLTLAVKDLELARSIMKAVEPDNRLPHLRIVGTAKSDSLAFDLKFDGGVETFISTLDDMLRCLQAAMETLGTIKKRELE